MRPAISQACLSLLSCVCLRGDLIRVAMLWLHVCCVCSDTLWVEKYKPRSTSELVGNQTNVSTLRQWLHQWEDVNLKGATPVQARGGGYQVRRHLPSAG